MTCLCYQECESNECEVNENIFRYLILLTKENKYFKTLLGYSLTIISNSLLYTAITTLVAARKY